MEAAKLKYPTKAAAPPFLQTIDDPYFDEAGPLSPDANVGGHRTSRVVSPTSPTGKLPADPLGQNAAAKNLAVARTRQLQYAVRAKQRRLNLLIGVVVFVVTLCALLYIGVEIFSRPQRDDVTATAAHVGDVDGNRTQPFDDSGLRRRLRMKRRTTPVEEERVLFEFPATAAVDEKGTDKTNAHRQGQGKPALLSPRADAIENGPLEVTVGEMTENTAANGIPEILRNRSSYRLLKHGSGNSMSLRNCSSSCKGRVAALMNELNEDYNPCANLYDHVCSNWQAKYASLAGKSGSYSVDDSILDKLRAQLAHHLLKVEEATFQESRQLFRDCVNGTLVSNEDLQYLIGHFQLDPTSSSVDALAETIVRLSRLGVSPFFDVVVNKKGNDFSVTLRPPTSIPKEIQNEGVFNGKRTGRKRQAGNKSAATASEAFIHAIERHLCYAVVGHSNPGASCFLTPESARLLNWNYEWYESTGLQHLAFHAASIFWPLFFAPQSSYSPFQPNLEIDDFPAHVEGCLRFIERYDPDLLAHSALSIAGTSFEQRGKMVMESLRRTLEQRVPDVPRISIKFAVPANGTEPRNGSTSTGNDHGSFNGFRLERYLTASTWKRWTQGVGSRYNALSTTPVLLKNTLYVPLSAFDLTSAVENSWLWYLSLFARVGPRLLKPILQSIPAEVLNETQLIRCLRNTYRANGGARSKTNFPSLDAAEIASFAYSLEAFRSHTALNAVLVEPKVSTEALFLYHYVFNKCTAVPSGEQERSDSVARVSRFEVGSVSRALGSSLLHECATDASAHTCF